MKQIYYISASWCESCQALSPTMERIGKEIKVNNINADYEPNVIKTYNVGSIPTVILTQNGEEIKRFVGNRSYEDIKQWINN